MGQQPGLWTVRCIVEAARIEPATLGYAEPVHTKQTNWTIEQPLFLSFPFVSFTFQVAFKVQVISPRLITDKQLTSTSE